VVISDWWELGEIAFGSGWRFGIPNLLPLPKNDILRVNFNCLYFHGLTGLVWSLHLSGWDNHPSDEKEYRDSISVNCVQFPFPLFGNKARASTAMP
jgi:hypothetical protein